MVFVKLLETVRLTEGGSLSKSPKRCDGLNPKVWVLSEQESLVHSNHISEAETVGHT